MITIHPEGIYLSRGKLLDIENARAAGLPAPEEARGGTMAASILRTHNISEIPGVYRLKFDAIASHDITYVGIIQTARAIGLDRFPLPYVLTNCHNSLCAVGGTINEDDHAFGLSAAQKYGGEYVPAHLAVIHQYMRERYAGAGKMILASDSHTRYGPYGTLAFGEGGPELVKQLMNRTYDIPPPQVAAIWLEGAPNPGVGPHDVALALIGATFGNGFLKNRILEFIGPGIEGLSMDFRNGIDVMTTETTCLSSIWQTDGRVNEELARFGRPQGYAPMAPADVSYYDALVRIDLRKIRPMIALPFHPSRAYTIAEFKQNAPELLHDISHEAARQWGIPVPLLHGKAKNGQVFADQGVVVGCAGGLYENIMAVRDILRGMPLREAPLHDAALFDASPSPFALSIYPASQPMALALARSGALADLMAAGATVRTAFCGPCFGAGDVPGDNALSLRHATRNFPNREGSKPGEGQAAFVALMDARSIAATARNGGAITAADDLPQPPPAANKDSSDYVYDNAPYAQRVFYGVGCPKPDTPLIRGPGIADWPAFPPLPDDLVITIAASLTDPVTTTDELIPSGETSSYRSNPYRLAEFTLSRKDPGYVARAKEILKNENLRRTHSPTKPALGSAVAAIRPGDGSAREQAASCQRVLGGVANIAAEYATSRYRSNLINWGMLPFIWTDMPTNPLRVGDKIRLRGLRSALAGDAEAIPAELRRLDAEPPGGEDAEQPAVADLPIVLTLPNLTRNERDIILAGCLINYHKVENV
ncbi:MAG: hydratase [Oscillospiraceae bacterium]|nr:hydratase [Oscillospiraceae bacterium]